MMQPGMGGYGAGYPAAYTAQLQAAPVENVPYDAAAGSAAGMEYGGTPTYDSYPAQSYDGDVTYDYSGYAGYEDGYSAGCDACSLPPRVYGSFDFLYVWRRGSSFPSGVLTTSDPVDEGILGAPSTQILFGGNEQADPDVGGRFTWGLWLDNYQDWSFGFQTLALVQENTGLTATTSQFPTLAVPFFNTNTNLQDSIVLSLPGNGTNAANNATVTLANENNVFTGNIFLTKHLYTSHANRVDFLTGYSWARIDDSFGITSTSTVQDLGGTLPVGTVVGYSDLFGAENEFHGGQFGAIAEFQDGPFSWRMMGKISVGNMRQTGSATGTFSVNGTTVSNTGIFAQTDNSGEYTRNVFAYIPEGNIDMIYAVNCNWDFKLGCTFIYFSDVITGGSLISTNVDPIAQTAGPFAFTEQDYWVLGMNFGGEFHY